MKIRKSFFRQDRTGFVANNYQEPGKKGGGFNNKSENLSDSLKKPNN